MNYELINIFEFLSDENFFIKTKSAATLNVYHLMALWRIL